MVFFFFQHPLTTAFYTLSLHDALPICSRRPGRDREGGGAVRTGHRRRARRARSEEHTSELQSRQYLVCRLLLEKKEPLSFLPSDVNQKQVSRSRSSEQTEQAQDVQRLL